MNTRLLMITLNDGSISRQLPKKFSRFFLVGRGLRTAPRKGLHALPIYADFHW
ncbi:MAG TPA: hypothetical protein VNX46_17765 [Candidatus Acidoferrum sp.]|nr:hypothetical protein [Candidatus Acidoferrum sp.]